MGEDVRNRCIAVINKWLGNILMTAPFDLPKKRGIVNSYSIALTWAGTFFNDLRAMVEMMSKMAKKNTEEYRRKH